MEEEETEISKEELQSWIADEVHKARLTSPGILKKYSLLRSLLERRQRQATRFLQLCQSLVVFENTVKELYSQLGLEYTCLDSESDDDDAEPTSCRRTLPFLFVSSEHRIHGPSASRVSTPRLSTPDVEEDQEETVNQKSPVVVVNKEAVVVLHKLTTSQIAATASPPLPDADDVEDADRSFGKSDGEWKPDREMSDSEYSVSDFGARSNRKRKLKSTGTHEKLNSASKRSRKSPAKAKRAKRSASSASTNKKGDCSVSETSGLPANSDGDAESGQRDTKERPSSSRKTTKCLTSGTKRIPQSSAKTTTTTAAKTTSQAKTTKTTTAAKTASQAKTTKTTTTAKTTSQAKTTKTTTESSTTSPTCQATVAQPATTPQSNAVSAKSNAVITFTPSASNRVVTPVSQQSSKTTGKPPSKPRIEIKLNMNVLARRKHMCWQRGKVAEIITKENGKVKYKITFEEKGKSLVSGHHLAYDGLPKLDELSIGCRVVVQCPSEKAEFQPGIMAELPGRKNRMRFLVYTDDHTPMYVGLPALRLVYKPLADPLDDILDEHHKEFIREYLRTWPYPPQTQYKIGQVMQAEYEGTMQKCEVLTVDCSLIEVVFESDQHKEWLYRGSLRLEHMIKMKYSKWKEGNTCT
ncbi:histone-lysine N-methyltransferase SETDB1-A isoform X3 [Fundulus heteroclitus]|uniref:histone-lysine N-methyltransferase SETDB1-A isoform X2 n=1 Tax=Fundulus heteroclitus TaxID=8078 RepID=UPI00165CB6B7|nr:histone-lysine N-methyltransferase SETDB1-A isoform X2 [Fundulus heteroclitus]XP_036001203.1 histone-lysine N-methyltransferase SETDB1-A isoform X3 [Fundulus heteroclitus]